LVEGGGLVGFSPSGRELARVSAMSLDTFGALDASGPGWNSNDLEGLVTNGIRAHEAGELHVALRWYVEALEVEPGNPTVL
jgi:hypothetical protein